MAELFPDLSRVFFLLKIEQGEISGVSQENPEKNLTKSRKIADKFQRNDTTLTELVKNTNLLWVRDPLLYPHHQNLRN